MFSLVLYWAGAEINGFALLSHLNSDDPVKMARQVVLLSGCTPALTGPCPALGALLSRCLARWHAGAQQVLTG